ncbi:MAG: alpha/beta fold hydrolase [Bacteroidota bacterium]
MKRISCITLILVGMLGICAELFAQERLVDVKGKTYKTTEKVKIKGEEGYLVVPENRKNSNSREIKIKYVHLKSTSPTPSTPIMYLEGGGATCTWQAESPEDLTDWLEILEVSDLIFVDQRGNEEDEDLTYIWEGDFPTNFFLTEETANQHFKAMVEKALPAFEERGVDVRGYNIEEHARDFNALATALGLDTYSIFGYSFGTTIGTYLMNLFPERIERAVLVGADAPTQALNYPSYLDKHVDTISAMVAQDPNINTIVPDFSELVEQVMGKLAKEPAMVTITNPLTREEVEIPVGPFGLALILRLDIDDAKDIPIMPRLLHSIDKGDYSMLTWFVQRRFIFGLGIAGNGINQYLASGASEVRWARIQQEAETSLFGNVVNFPFSAAKDHWVENEMSIDPTLPIQSDIPTLFISGSLDARTPPAQVNETMKGFSEAYHVEIENAGHDQVLWNLETFDNTIPAFLKGEAISNGKSYYSDIKFLPVEGEVEGHPAVE